ncbi:hypothetical protein AC480_03390 [miscellaneous Crenarchaeota group archaeon SMTZ1-55]|nr:MAG: hypothetical protein AC480_03390 [miscellaneous Crenarchaeota group archaeon SMTZ1-55]
MGQNGHFLKHLGSLHERHETPWVAIACSFTLIILFSSIDDLEFIIYSITFGFLTGFPLVNVALIKLRHSQPSMKRPFKTPLYPLPPIIGIVTSIGLLAFFDAESLTFGIVWGLIGSVVYSIQ